MSKKFALFLLVLITILSGCQRPPKAEIVQISEEQAKLIVEQYHKKNSNYNIFGAIKITSIKHFNNEYEVKWERKSNCENGTDYVNDKDGTMGNSVVSIC
ncbi:hypothetical protein MUG84_23785 [Paenibacillus sp. KQZ6P-2]|uniref:Uncharacterized protein n=1 Tax=Paenibacillus mangrovi TaxID=2931978 RepID=A0A9X1WTC2_9BACL|nr:hypothetical protein [Paenibacillus mangrovi]MCJ8014709.1 hypothetical protein [Paenibacillus mangrovi]